MTDFRMTRRIAGMLGKSLMQAQLHQVPDPRDRRGRRWKLATLLNTAIVGMAAGCNSLSQVERLTRDMSSALRRWLGIGRRVPDTTLRDALCALSPETLVPSLHAIVLAAFRRKALRPHALPFGVLSLDGKGTSLPSCDDWYAQRQSSGDGSLRGTVRSVTATLVSIPARPCIDITPIPAHTNEMGIFEKALKSSVATYGRHDLFRLVTYDAGACSLKNASLTRDLHLHYLFGLKQNQGALYDEAVLTLGCRSAASAEAQSVDVAVGKTTTRRLYSSPAGAAPEGWTHLRTILRIQSETCDATGNVVSQEDRYFISSLAPDRLSAEQWLTIVRRHWGVEITHQTLDVSFKEDTRPWSRDNPRGMLVVAILRRMAYTLLTLFRSVTQRSNQKRALPWAELLWNIQLAVLTTHPGHLLRLKHRPTPETG